MRRARFAAVVALCGATIAAVLAGAVSSASAGSTAVHSALRNQRTLADRIVAEINTVRADHRLSRVTWARGLAAAAHQHSDEMASLGYFGHTSPDGTTLEQRLEHFFPATSFRFWTVGETLLWSSPTISPAAAVQAWLKSPEHHRILLDPAWHQIGISAVHAAAAPGVYGTHTVTVITADFGTRTR
jgi:uncharacterized protein YkwD